MKNNFQKNHLFLFVFIISLGASFLVFGNGITGEFVFDDVTVIQKRGDLINPSNFFNLFISPYHQNNSTSGLYRPFTMATYSLNHNIFGPSPISFHVVNIFIHALNSLLVFWLINFLFKNKFLSYSTFLLFLLHPIHTEAVTSIVGRAELLSFLFSITSVYFFLNKYKTLSAVAFLLALLSKESALVVLPVILYICVVFWNKNILDTVKKLWFFSLPLCLYSLLRHKALGGYFFGDTITTIVENPLRFVSFSERIATALKVLYMYVERLVWPIDLSADYSFDTIKIISNPLVSIESVIGLLILILLIIIIYKKTNKEYSFGAIMFLFPYLIISNLIKPIGTIMGERLMYFPSLGFAVVSALLIDKLLNKGRFYKVAGYFLLIFIVGFYGIRTFIRNKDWHDDKTLFYATVKESPNSSITRTALAGVHIRANEWDLAKEQLEIARKIHEDSSHLQNLLGVVADHEGNFDLAEEKYKKSLELNPNATDSSINLARLYLKEGRLEEAGENFLKVIDFYATTEYIVRYSYIQIALNKPDKALDMINKYFGYRLNSPDISALVGTAYFVKKDYGQALIYLKKALELGNKASEITQMIEIAEQK